MILQLEKNMDTPCIPKIFTINGKNAYIADFGNFEKAKSRSGGCKARLFTRRPPNKYTLHIYDIAESEYYNICEKLEELLSIRACTKCKRGKR